MAVLKGSVGLGGRNLPDDVTAVQILLKKAGADPGRVDGVCGPKTIAAITNFQKKNLGVSDGRVDPGGAIWQKLSGSSASVTPAATISGYWSGDSSQWSQQKKLESLEPGFRAKVQIVLHILTTKRFQPKIFFGWRSVQVQEQLYKQGKTKVHFSFHNAQRPDGTPNAYAADVVDSRWGWEDGAAANGYWDALGKAAKAVGLVWGGDWKGFPDVAHVQGRQNSELAAVKKESGL
jgi:hypothetical protein